MDSTQTFINEIVKTVTKNKVFISWTASTASGTQTKIKYEILLDGKVYKTSKTYLTVSSLALGNHDFRIRMVKDSTPLEWTDAQTFRVADYTPPKLSKIYGTVDAYSGIISWKPGTDNVKVTKYTAVCDSTVLETESTSVTFENLSVGKHKVILNAFDAEGNISKSKKVTVNVKDVTAPDKTENLQSAQDTKYRSLLTWNAAWDNVGVTKYFVKIDGGKSKTLSGSKLQLLTSKLPIGVHTFAVAAQDKAKNTSEWSETFTFLIKDTTPPSKVSVKAKTASDIAELTWKTPKDNTGVKGYTLDVFKDGMKYCDTLTLDAGINSYVFNSLAHGKYAFYMSAFDAEGNTSAVSSAKANVKGYLA